MALLPFGIGGGMARATDGVITSVIQDRTKPSPAPCTPKAPVTSSSQKWKAKTINPTTGGVVKDL